MSDETIVAVYDTAAHAEAAVADLIAAKVPQSAISRHAGTGTSTGTSTGTGMSSSSGMSAAAGAGTSPSMGTGLGAAQPREQGFWASLFGGDSATDATVYDRSMDTGSSVVVVKAPASEVDAVMAILERHSPIDIDERATGYGLGATAATATTTTASAMPMPAAKPAMATTTTGDANKIQLAEESLAVGTRLVNRGGTRIRRYVVETPVEQSVTLHDEKVMLERRPVTDGRALQDGNFSEKTIEMTQTGEEAVVGKTARVVEEVSLRKEATERVETVRDTVRKEQVEVEQIPVDATIKPVPPKV